jgi:hypothetical protein
MTTATRARRGTRGSRLRRRAAVAHAGRTVARSFAAPGGSRRARITMRPHVATRNTPAMRIRRTTVASVPGLPAGSILLESAGAVRAAPYRGRSPSQRTVNGAHAEHVPVVRLGPRLRHTVDGRRPASADALLSTDELAASLSVERPADEDDCSIAAPCRGQKHATGCHGVRWVDAMSCPRPAESTGAPPSARTNRPGARAHNNRAARAASPSGGDSRRCGHADGRLHRRLRRWGPPVRRRVRPRADHNDIVNN